MGEPVTANLIRESLTVFKCIFSDPQVRKVILDGENDLEHMSLWTKIGKLYTVVMTCGKNKEQIILGLNSIRDWYHAGYLQEVTIRTLSGKGMAGNKGMLHIAMYKEKCRTYALGHVLDKLPFTSDSKALIRKVLADHKAYRQNFGWPQETMTLFSRLFFLDLKSTLRCNST